jgi:purine-binding chemotaxis protein CheW
MQLALETTVVLLCRVGTHFCALPIEHVSETMRPLSVVPLAGTPAFVFGLSIIRGSPVPVIDAGQLVGVTGQRRPARFVTIKVNKRSLALAVDAVVGIRTLASDSLRTLDPLLQETGAGAVAAIGVLDAELLAVLQSARIVSDSVWKVIEANEAHPQC